MSTTTEAWDSLIEQQEIRVAKLQRDLEVDRAVLARMKEHRERASGTLTKDIAPTPEARRGNMAPLSSKSIPDAAAEVLREHGEPMQIAAIANELERRGIRSQATKGMSSLVSAAISRRDDLFFKVKRGVIGLKGWNQDTAGEVMGIPLPPEQGQLGNQDQGEQDQ